MRRLVFAGIAMSLLASVPARAQQQPEPKPRWRETPYNVVRPDRDVRIPSSADHGQNLNTLQGRRNATEDASRASQGPWNQRGFLEGAGSYY